MGFIPGLGKSLGEGNGNPLHYSCLGNPTDRRTWQATVPGVEKLDMHALLCSVQLSHSVVSDSFRPHRLQRTRLPYHQLPELAQTHVHQVSDAIHPSHSLSSSSPAFNLSHHQGFSNESILRSFSFSISPSNEHPGLISFRMDWLVLLAVQGTFKSLLQYHDSKASILMTLAQVP